MVDPCGASDAFLRTGTEAFTHQEAAFAEFTAAGFDRHAVDTVLLSHLDGIGMVAWATAEGWEPAFPNANVIVSKLERQSIRDYPDAPGAQIFEKLDRAGVVQTVDLPHQLTEHITLTHTGVHSAGHLVAVLSSDSHQAALLGHIAISPIHLHDQVPATAHIEPDNAPALIAEWIHFAATNDALLFGPLWPAPGACLLYTSPSPRDATLSRMPSSA